jgi:hypothetical protein
MQWPIEKGQNDKQISTKLYIEKYRLSYTNSTKTGSELRCSGRVCSSVDVIDFHVKYGIYMHGDAET